MSPIHLRNLVGRSLAGAVAALRGVKGQPAGCWRYLAHRPLGHTHGPANAWQREAIEDQHADFASRRVAKFNGNIVISVRALSSEKDGASQETTMSAPSFVTVFALYPDLTQLDFTGPHQVLCRIPGATTIIASRMGGEIEAEGGLVIGRTTPLADIERCDLICVPGGMTATQAALDEEFVAHVRRLALGARYVTSVCTGSLILGAAGLLQGKRAACHWAWRSLLTEFGAIPDEARVVRDGNIFTGGGVTAGIDFAFTMLTEISGEAYAKALTLGLEYAPSPPYGGGRPELADEATLRLVSGNMNKVMPQRLAEAQEAGRRLSRYATSP
jgi:putative intracellular protease/amidase